MSTNIELETHETKNGSQLQPAAFFWTDTTLFDNYRQQNIHTLIALQKVIERHRALLESEDHRGEIGEFLETFAQISNYQADFFLWIWSDPAAYHWCQLAFDLVKAALTKKPLPSVTRQYCGEIKQKTPLKALIAHLNQFKLFAIAHALLSGRSYNFKIPFYGRLPLAIPGTSFYLEGTGEVEIYGIEGNKLDVGGQNQREYLELTANALLKGGNLKVGQCPTLYLQGGEFRFQPYCFNSPAFPDGQAVVKTGMAYQEKYINLVRDGLALIEQYHPQTFGQLHYFMEVIALKPLEEGTFTNLSSSDFPGALICSVIDNPYRLADNFIHEFHHNRLFLIEQNNPLLCNSLEEDQANSLYYSPWRQDLRPLRGIFHAVYVYTPVTRFWLNFYRSNPEGEKLDFAKSQLMTNLLQLQIGLEQLRKYGQFTDLGRDLWQELQSNVAQIAQDAARLGIGFDTPALEWHRNGSFQYQLEGKTARFLTVKEVIARHIQCLDHFRQIEPQFQSNLGLDSFSEGNGEDKKLAIAYGQPITGKLEVVSSLAAILKQQLEKTSQGYLVDLTGKSPINRTYGEIWQRSTILLGYLQAQGLSPGDFVIIQIEQCHEFVAAVWSCFLGGFVPVPVAVSFHRPETTPAANKLEQVWQTLANPVILTTKELAASMKTRCQPIDARILTLEKAENFAPSQNFHTHQPEDLALLLTTSGTTGNPKLVSFDALTVIRQFFGENEQDDESSCFLTWIPCDNASGMSIIKPKLGQTLYLPPASFFGNPLRWIETVDRYRVKTTVLTNFAMTRIIEEVKAIAQKPWDLSSLQTIGLGAEKIVPQTCRSFLETLQPLALPADVLSLAYGLSETGVVASTRKWTAMGYNSHSQQFVQIGQPLPGCGLRIVDGENNLLAEGDIGSIQIWSAGIARGYYDNPSLNRTLFSEDGWFNTGDLGFLNDGYLTVTGREKEIIIVNGKNYSCQEIEAVVEEVEGVQPFYTVASSCGQADSETEQLGIFFNTSITKESDLGNLAKNIRGKLTQTLGINPKYLIPLQKSAIPRTSTGKIQRLSLKQRLETGEFTATIKWVDALIQQTLEQTYRAPRNQLEGQLTQIWKKILGLKEVGIYDNFFDLGGDSILAVKLVAEIEKICSKELSIVVLYQAPTVEKLAKILSRGEWSSSWYSLVPIQPLGDKIPLFAIHLLGEGLSFYRPLANYLGLRQPIYGLNYGLAARKGKEKEDKLPPIENLAAHYIEEMQAFYPQGPYILLGVSNGGNVAFEMAKQLQAQGQTVAKLILFDTLHPHLKLPPHWKKGSRFQKLMSELIRYSQIYWGNFLLFEPQERVSYLLEKLKSLSVQKIIQRTSFPVQPSEKTLETKPLEASLPRLYLPQSYPGKITLFRAKHTGINAFDPTNGWEGVADEGLEIYDIHGAHSHIFSEPSVRILSEKLRDCLTTDLLT